MLTNLGTFAWDNFYVKNLIVYFLYILIVVFILFPVSRKLIVYLINKTNSNIDNKIYGKIKVFIRLLIILLGINLVYNLYLVELNNYYYQIAYQIVLTFECILVYIILNRVFKILINSFGQKFSIFMTENFKNFIKLIVNIFLFSIILLFLLKIWGVNITPFLASAGIFGVAVAMASKSIIENFLSGLILLTDKSINVGDVISLGDDVVVVEEINIRTTRLRTFDGNVVIIPNSQLLNEKIVNKSLLDKKMVKITIGISYGNDIEKAKSLLREYLLKIEGVDADSVVVYLDNLGDWSVNVTGKVMIDANKWSYLLEKQVIEEVYKNFPENGLSFPFPTYEIIGNNK